MSLSVTEEAHRIFLKGTQITWNSVFVEIQIIKIRIKKTLFSSGLFSAKKSWLHVQSQVCQEIVKNIYCVGQEDNGALVYQSIHLEQWKSQYCCSIRRNKCILHLNSIFLCQVWVYICFDLQQFTLNSKSVLSFLSAILCFRPPLEYWGLGHHLPKRPTAAKRTQTHSLRRALSATATFTKPLSFSTAVECTIYATLNPPMCVHWCFRWRMDFCVWNSVLCPCLQKGHSGFQTPQSIA